LIGINRIVTGDLCLTPGISSWFDNKTRTKSGDYVEGQVEKLIPDLSVA
jgi:hypothetical protein